MRLVAIGFALGSLEHAVGLILMGFGVHLYSYPAWRHAAFVVADSVIAYVAARRPERALWLLTAFLIEQLATHGPEEWRHWQLTHHLPWFGIGYETLLVAAVIVAARYRGATPVESGSGPVARR